MSIVLNHEHIGDAQPMGPPFGAPGIGFTRLKFPVILRLGALAEPGAYLTSFTAEVSAAVPGKTQRPLGRAQPQGSWVVHTIKQAHPHPFELQLDLPGEHLDALERLRGGGGLEFRVGLHLQIHHRGVIHPASADVRFLVNESDWAQILRQVGYLDHLILAVELPFDVPERFRHALKLIRNAHTDLIAGRYDAAVRACRMAMESVGAMTGDEATQTKIARAFAGPREEREAMGRGERAELVRLAVRHFTNPAHHVGEDGAPEEFSRHDALFILAAAAGVIWEAIARARALP